MNRSDLARWLVEPVVRGKLALLMVILAVAIPTAIRAAVHGTVTGCEFTPFLPFVLVTAILIGGRHAAVVSVASVAVLGGLFAGPLSAFLEQPCAQSAAGIFLGASAIIIGVVTMIRRAISEALAKRADSSSGGIIFSLDKGEVWASWNGSGPPMRLGSQDRVEEMMEDFLAQGELGRRLLGKFE